MAQKRMFSQSVVLSDDFLDMPASTRCLYFSLGMVADDDGFVNNPKSIMRQCGGTQDDFKLLLSKGYVYLFASGVIVIMHWNVNNYLRKDRYVPTKYIGEKSQLSEAENGTYWIASGVPVGIPSRNQPVYPEKIRIEQNSEVERAAAPPRTRFVPPTLEDVKAYCLERKNDVDAERFFDFYSANGWKQGHGKPIVDWKAAVRTWERQTSVNAGKEVRDHVNEKILF